MLDFWFWNVFGDWNNFWEFFKIGLEMGFLGSGLKLGGGCIVEWLILL